MKKNSTHITIILDRTGSMESIRDDAIGGFNAFLKKQQEQPGDATLSLVQFDSQEPFEVVHSFKKIAEVPELTQETFVPRSMTPLLDAMGRGIIDLEKNLAAMKPEEHPGKVIMVVITDGCENDSQEFSRNQIARMIRQKEEKMDWQFVFLGTDMNGIRDAHASGFAYGKSIHFRKDAAGTRAAFCSVSEGISKFRNDQSDDVSFTDDDRSEQQ